VRFIERLDLVHAFQCCSRARSSMQKPGLPEFGVPVVEALVCELALLQVSINHTDVAT
jgi:hypothetical protein